MGYKIYKQNLPHPIWVPLEIKADLPLEAQDQMVRDLKENLVKEPVLSAIVKDLNLQQAWSKSSEAEAQQYLKQLIYVKRGKMDTPMGKAPSVHVGVQGKEKNRDLTQKILLRLMKDVAVILGIDLPDSR